MTARQDQPTPHNGPALGTRAGPSASPRASLTVIDCRVCGFAHLETLPNEATLADFYRDDFWTKEKPGALARIERQWQWLREIYGDWLEVVELYTPGRRLLDVGCGYGHFLKAAFERGFDVEGIDPSERAVRYASIQTGCRPWLGLWDEVPFPFGGGFSVLSALWLVEHLPNPLRFLRWAHDHLAPGGVLLVAVPNDFSAIQERVNGKVGNPSWWLHHTHCNYFNWTTLANVLGRAGFRVVERLTMYPMENFLDLGHDYTVNDAFGEQLHRQVEAQDLILNRRERIARYADMARRGEGRELIVVGVRE